MNALSSIGKGVLFELKRTFPPTTVSTLLKMETGELIKIKESIRAELQRRGKQRAPR